MPFKSTSKARKRAASNVAETVPTKKARKAKQQALPEEPELVGADQGEEEGRDEKKRQGKGKPGGRGRGGKGRGKGGRYVPWSTPLSPDDHFLQDNISTEGRGSSQSRSPC